MCGTGVTKAEASRKTGEAQGQNANCRPPAQENAQREIEESESPQSGTGLKADKIVPARNSQTTNYLGCGRIS